MSRYIQAGGPRQRFQSACGDAPSDAFLAGVNCRILMAESVQLFWSKGVNPNIKLVGSYNYPGQRKDTISERKMARLAWNAR
jgi:hypothetical protein